MTLTEWIGRFNSATAEIEANAALIMLEVGTEAKRLISDRVIKRGEKADGSKFHSPNNPSGYSQIPMLVNRHYFHNKGAANMIAGSKKKRQELKWVTIKRGEKNVRLFELPRGYEQYRELHNRRVDIVNFSFTNRMWNNIQVKEYNRKEVIVTALNKEEHKKLSGLSKRFGWLLELSEKEKSYLRGVQKKRIVEILNKHGV